MKTYEISNCRGYSIIGLDNPKFDLNVGEVLRAAGCYGCHMVVVKGDRYHHSRTDTQKAYRHIPLMTCEDLRKMVPYDCVPVAVDLVPNARPLHSYVHPERCFYVFGPEDGTLDQSVTSWCRESIYIPTRFCMNLAACVNVVMYDRQAKMLMKNGMPENRENICRPE